MSALRIRIPTAVAALLLALGSDGLFGQNPPQNAARPNQRQVQVPPPMWLWDAEPKADQAIFVRRTFNLPLTEEQLRHPLTRAVFWGSGDNEIHCIINGTPIGFTSQWERPMFVEIAQHLKPGRNVIGLRAMNKDSRAGVIGRIMIAGPDRRMSVINTDQRWKLLVTKDPDQYRNDKTWLAADFDDSSWKAPKVLGPLGMNPWGNLPGADGRPPTATPAETLTLLDGFRAELLYSVPKNTQGSWVAMTPDPKGRLIVSDQTGPLYRVSVGRTAEHTQVEKIELPIGHAQGLLYALDSLYVVVNGNGIQGNGSGLYRLRDTDGDDKFDKLETLARFQGAGEHGPHAVRLHADGKLYLIAGNFTKPPQSLSANSPHRNFAEDLLLPRNPDGGGHDPNIMAPGGWVARCDPDGKEFEFLGAGQRNAYDFDFNHAGDVFTYDSDMEWDTGTPWYRPTRLLAILSGSEYGWRNGTGKWPDYYPDSLPAVANTGPGSPTGVVFGYQAKFPAKYQHALYLCDWSYGTLYAAHVTPQGAGYTATFEPFVRGKGWALTDVVINTDGHMYATIGGRGTQSGLYRITYSGPEPTTPVSPTDNPQATRARELRRTLESFHGREDPGAVAAAMPHLNSTDRYLRYAARVALESQPIDQWQHFVLGEKRPTALINGIVGLVRANARAPEALLTNAQQVTEYKVRQTSLRPRIVDALNRLNLKTLSEEQQLEALRAYGLAFIRMGKPDESTARAVAERVDALFPHPSPAVNREASQLLAYLQHPPVVAKAMDLLTNATTQEDQLHYVLTLRVVNTGWTIEQRKAYFAWIYHALGSYKGGNSFKRFLARIKDDAVKTLTDAEKTQLDALLKGEPGSGTIALKQAKPRQFVRNWQMQDLLPDIDLATRGRNFESGKAAFNDAQCAACHRFAGDGGATGPDLTGVGNRFQAADVLEATLLPSKVISDQYQTYRVDTKDGDTHVGRITYEDDVKLQIATNPFTPDAVEVPKSQIQSKGVGELSMMPQGLVDNLTRDEILDLIAYIRSAGDPKDKAFAK